MSLPRPTETIVCNILNISFSLSLFFSLSASLSSDINRIHQVFKASKEIKFFMDEYYHPFPVVSSRTAIGELTITESKYKSQQKFYVGCNLPPEIADIKEISRDKQKWRCKPRERRPGKYFNLGFGLSRRDRSYSSVVIYLRHSRRILLFRAALADLALPFHRVFRRDPARPSDLEDLPALLFQYHLCHLSLRTDPAVLFPLAVLPHPESHNSTLVINRNVVHTPTIEASRII